MSEDDDYDLDAYLDEFHPFLKEGEAPPGRWVPGGGENHPDAVLSKQSIWLDGEPIVRDGRIVGPPRLAELAEKLG